MPGPKSEPKAAENYRDDVREVRAKVKPNRKSAARLADRIASSKPVNPGKWAQGYHTPGSQNRNK